MSKWINLNQPRTRCSAIAFHGAAHSCFVIMCAHQNAPPDAVRKDGTNTSAWTERDRTNKKLNLRLFWVRFGDPFILIFPLFFFPPGLHRSKRYRGRCVRVIAGGNGEYILFCFHFFLLYRCAFHHAFQRNMLGGVPPPAPYPPYPNAIAQWKENKEKDFDSMAAQYCQRFSVASC